MAVAVAVVVTVDVVVMTTVLVAATAVVVSVAVVVTVLEVVEVAVTDDVAEEVVVADAPPPLVVETLSPLVITVSTNVTVSPVVAVAEANATTSKYPAPPGPTETGNTSFPERYPPVLLVEFVMSNLAQKPLPEGSSVWTVQ